jgi:hypothetical protein
MSFTDTGRVDELHLCSRISLRADDGKSWITGKVIELALLGDDEVDIRITLKTKDGETIVLDRTPDTMIILEWGDDE